ncbi:MAG: acyl-CoA dehydrogenase family protein [Chloroflexi bacterium]|nr:acyl-CoA dehydrogenase family protein [Chloroflexota bacterium]
MDFRFKPEEEAFRQEVRTFLETEWPAAIEKAGQRRLSREERETLQRSFTKKIIDKGWLAIGWPTEYGGGGKSCVEQMVFKEECAYVRAPAGGGLGVSMVGPSILSHGTEEQKQFFIPKIMKNEMQWCQGFSEPNAGSDLASLQTRAVQDGDDYVINGQKIWTSGAHRADWNFMLARTDPDAPKHRGITYFLIDMKNTPGMTIRPLRNMAGGAEFCEVFYDNVRVPAANILGKKNEGFYVATTTLEFERSSIGSVAGTQRDLEELVDFARETKINGKAIAENQRVRHKLADIAIGIQMVRNLAYRVTWMQTKRMRFMHEASIGKLFLTELMARMANVGMEMIGLYGLLERGSKWAPLRGRLETTYMTYIGFAIGGGTSEIQRNTIATRGLGLPR